MVLKTCHMCRSSWCHGSGGWRLSSNKALISKRHIIIGIIGEYYEGGGKSPFLCHECVKKVEQVDRCNKIIANAESSYQRKDELLKEMRQLYAGKGAQRQCSSPLKIWEGTTHLARSFSSSIPMSNTSPTKPKSLKIMSKSAKKRQCSSPQKLWESAGTARSFSKLPRYWTN